MRECLGWVTTCSDEKRCPQNWLEFAVTELPTRTPCHVCDRQVELVATEDAMDGAVADGKLAALPVVPPAGSPALYGRYAAHPLGASGGPGPSPGPSRSAAEVVVPERPNGAGRGRTTEAPAKTFYCVLATGDAVKIDKDAMVIGRSRTCDVVIPSAKVSRQHASLARVGNDLFIEDLGSANGVWRNGEKLSGRTKVNPNDVFTISEETLTFEVR